MANRKPLFDELVTDSGVLCSGVEETVALGRSLGSSMVKGSVVSLDGPLGAGKTHFVKGLAEGLGCDEPVSSPTFAVLHEYPGPEMTLFHFDFYRLGSAEEAITAGLDDCLDAGVTVVEWGGKFSGLLPPETLRLEIDVLPGDVRRIRSVR